MMLLDRLRIEFWWRIEKIAGRLWDLLCPRDRVSYWLDWFPAWAHRHRKQAELTVYRKNRPGAVT